MKKTFDDGKSLIPALFVKEELEKKIRETLQSDRYFYLSDSSIQFAKYIKIPDADTTGEEMYAITAMDHCIVGYVRANLDWYRRQAYCSGFCAFGSSHIGPQIEEYIDSLVHRFHVVVWDMIVGNPIEPFFDRILKKYDGYSFIRKDHAVLEDGKFYDEKTYYIVSPWAK